MQSELLCNFLIIYGVLAYDISPKPKLPLLPKPQEYKFPATDSAKVKELPH